MVLDKKLFTWVDIEDVFFDIQEKGELPSWITWIRVYWSGIILGVNNNCTNSALKWIELIFEPRYDSAEPAIILESDGLLEDRKLSIEIEEITQSTNKLIITPTFSRPSVLLKNKEMIRPEIPDDAPPIITVHSFKGGVGKTSTAISLACSFVKRTNERVLLIDGDFEAPGISWTLSNRIPDPPIAYSDVLAIIHSDPDPTFQTSLDLTSNYLENSIIDNIIVLPSYHTPEQYINLQITPESLTKNESNPFILTTFLSALGKKLNVSAIIVDLRAGLSELSAGLILDSRVNRIFVTTLNPQSIEGTKKLIKNIIQKPGSKPQNDDPIPLILLNQIPQTVKETDLYQIKEEFLDLFVDYFSENQDAYSNYSIKENKFKDSLLVIPKDWDEICNAFIKSEFINVFYDIVDNLTSSSVNIPTTDKEQIINYRKNLESFAHQMIFSDNNPIDKFLITNSIKNLVTRFFNQIPIAIIMGQKGSGKTYLYNQLCRLTKWEIFTNTVIGQSNQTSSNILPVIQSKNTIPEIQDRTIQARQEIANILNIEKIPSDYEITDYIYSNLSKTLSEPEWRKIWLQCIAASVGYNTNDVSSWDTLLSDLKIKKQSIIAIFDGIEDIFQDIYTNENQKIALRSLLQEVPRLLEQIPGNVVGLLVFIRKDIASYSISQNFPQFDSKYSTYSLKWDLLEALKFVKWVIIESGYIKFNNPDIDNLTKENLLEDLIHVWGKKLGRDNSKESNSAQWVIGALSDFNGQIQPRDIARFLDLSASISQSEEWLDRLLTPTAIKKSIKNCSLNKLQELKKENKQIEPILVKLEKLDSGIKKIPFKPEDLNLSNDDIDLLETNGMIIMENGLCYMPEIIRQGLDFTYTVGARPRVIMYSKQKLNW